MPSRVFDVLLVEDHPADVILTRKAFALIGSPVTLHVAVDGFEALAFLRKEGRHKDAPRPDLVLLDLNMPRRDGRAVLRDVKTDPTLMTIPVVVLTTSSAPQDVRTAYELHANGYIAKPVSFDDFHAAIESIERYWFNTLLLPSP